MAKLFIVTGSSRGLGKELFEVILKKNHYVVGVSRKRSKGSENVQEHYFYADFTVNDFEITTIVEDIFLKQDITEIILINNAGVIEPISKMEQIEDFQEVENHINVNYLAPIKLVNQILKIKGDRLLKIINISTGAAKRPIAGWALYCSSKVAISMYLKTIELEDNNVFLEEIDPGIMDTDMQKIIRNSNEEDFPLVQDFISYKENNKLKSPKEVANQILKEYLI